MRPERVVVISLAGRADRRATQGDLSARLGIPVRTVWATGPEQVSLPATWGASAAAYGCLLSHRGVLSQALAEGDTSVLVFEDDAVVPVDFWASFDRFCTQVPEHWAGLWLGGEHVLPPAQVVPGVVRCRYTTRTHAYLLRGVALARTVVEMDRAKHHWDMQVGSAMEQWGDCYSPTPFLVNTTGSSGDIPDSTPLIR